MKVTKIPFDHTGYFSSSFIDYVKEDSKLRPFYGLFPTIDNFRKQIDLKNFPNDRRQRLHETLKKQYQNYSISEATEKNIDLLLSKNTYTVTTGHQLNIFTGPLYFLYKIITTIKTAQQLSDTYKNYNFVPVYWMGSEDHDFEEICYFWFNNKKFQWKTDQAGAVGRFNPAGLKDILKELPGDQSVFEYAYTKFGTLSESVRYYVNHLLGKYGIVVVEADDPGLKAQFKEVIKSDLFDQTSFHASKTSTETIQELGYPAQVYSREINFFYLKDQLRERIEPDGSDFKVVNTEIRFSREEIEEEIETHPERFSPNVVLRPLYQEYILPNLSYIGGPSEVVYWFQLKEIFKKFNVAFPILQPRNFGLVIPKHIARKWGKTGYELEDLFRPTEELVKAYTIEHSQHELTLENELTVLANEFEAIKEKASQIDITLGKSTEAAFVRMKNSVNKLEKKMVRAEKRNLSDRTRQITDVKEYLFPGENLQERRDNFLNFYMGNPEFLDDILKAFDPLDLKFHIMLDE